MASTISLRGFTQLVAGHARAAVRNGQVVETFSSHQRTRGHDRSYHRVTIGADTIEAAHQLTAALRASLHEGKGKSDEYGRPYAAFHRGGIEFLVRTHVDPMNPRVELLVNDVRHRLSGFAPGEEPGSDKREFPKDYQDTSQQRLKIVRSIQDAAHR